MPVTGSSFALSWPMVHDGVMRRSEEEFSEVTWRGISPAVCMFMSRRGTLELGNGAGRSQLWSDMEPVGGSAAGSGGNETSGVWDLSEGASRYPNLVRRLNYLE